MITNTYRVAGHDFQLSAKDTSAIWGCLEGYKPFLVSSVISSDNDGITVSIDADGNSLMEFAIEGSKIGISLPASGKSKTASSFEKEMGALVSALSKVDFISGSSTSTANSASEADNRNIAFHVTLVSKMNVLEKELIWSGREGHEDEPTIEIYACGDKRLFCVNMPGNDLPSAQMLCSANNKVIKIGLCGRRRDALQGFYSAMMIAFTLATADKGTLLTHSSATLFDGRAYLFHAKSGTGKSTHSSLWRKYLPTADVLNDDHPIIRVMEDGEIRVFGSPWSGKTPCYKNSWARLGALVRLSQAPENVIRRLSTLEGYASLSSSCLSMTWDRALKDALHETIERVATAVPCFRLECRPDKEAVEMCFRAVTGREALDA
jgi:hypothetical protein